MQPLAAFALLLLLAGCGTPGPSARLPEDAVIGAGDPTRAAILGTAYAFATPSSLAGHPDAAARALAQVEYLTIELPTGPRWVVFTPTLWPQLEAARTELRAALGIAADAAPQAVVDQLYAVGRALRSGDAAAARAALTPEVFADRDATLARLASLPPLPRTQLATAMAGQELTRTDQDGRFNSGETGGGRGS